LKVLSAGTGRRTAPWDQLSQAYATQNSAAQVYFTLDTAGRVHVTSIVPGSDPVVATACKELLEQGPAWTPAQDESGNAVPYEDVYTCRLNVAGSMTSPKLHTMQVAAGGPIPADQVARAVSEHLLDLAK
jgi:hypothetical protein